MPNVLPYSHFTEFDINLFKLGKHYRLYNKLGSFPIEVNEQKGVYFAVWVPSAKSVSVIGDFNYWQANQHQLLVRWDSSGIWEGFIPNLDTNSLYKYSIHSNNQDIITEKSDPYARFCEIPPKTASIVWKDSYHWQDESWMKNRAKNNNHKSPISIYEIHLGSWQHHVEEDRPLSYRELADKLPKYLTKMAFTHVEFMPIMEYPYAPSWGYQITGYFAPTSRFGTPEDFKYLIDKLHQSNIGVILDWVPSHFPKDAHGLGNFDGSHLYEHPDTRRGYHPDWQSLIFNYDRNEVKAFLISNALYWLDHFHIDGLRVDAVASMIFLDYSRDDGQWEANLYGGNENLEAIAFLKEFNEVVYDNFPDVQTIAEESTAFPMVSRPTFLGGLGFGMKWMMGWMHDTLEYFKKETIYRQYHHNQITFSLAYAFTENYVLPLSHDEVVYGKGSILHRMPGDEWQKFANLRALYGYMYAHPGIKLLFMGNEIGQGNEWDFNSSIEWHLLDYDFHKGVQKLIKILNKLYRSTPELYKQQFDEEGCEWISYDDNQNSVISFIRYDESNENMLISVSNLTPIVCSSYRIGLPKKGVIVEVFNSDDIAFGGSGVKNKNGINIVEKPWNGKSYSAEIILPPLSTIYFKLK